MKNNVFRFLIKSLCVCCVLAAAFTLQFTLTEKMDAQTVLFTKAEAATYSGECGENVSWSLDTDTGVLNITGSGKMNSYSSASAPWYSYCSDIKTVNISDEVTSIGTYAFSGCSSLINVEISDSVTSIGSGAFSDCSSLTSIEIPDNVTSIGNSAFGGCSSLENMTLPFVGGSEKTSISTKQYPFGYIFGTGSYTGGVQITQYYYGDSTSSTTYSNYYIPSTLKEVTITGGNILYGAFYGCSNLTSIKLPSDMTSIGGSAFYDCTSLTSIEIPDGVTTIGSNAFRYCSSLTNFIVDEDSSYYSSLDGVLFNKAQTELILYPIGNARINYKVPDSVTKIGTSAFSDCSNLTSIEIPNSVTSIGSSAFSGCNSLESMTLPFVGGSKKTSSSTYQYPFGYIFGTSSYTGGVATQQYYYYSTSSTTYSSYYIPSTLKEVTITGGNILYGAFYGCSNLTSIKLPNNITSIGDSAFYNCSSLTSIEIPDGVTTIGSNAFRYCSSIKNFIVDEDNNYYSSLDGVLFNEELTDLIQYPAGNTRINYEIPDCVTSIKNYAFYGCSSLIGIKISDSVTSIGEYAFSGCSSLTSIEIPNSVTSIGSSAFSGCSSLESITLPFVGASKKTSSSKNQYPFGYIFGTSSYTGGVKTTQYYYGDSTSSTTYSYYYIPSTLKEVTITGGNILYGAFYGCSKLTSIKLPSDITSIGSDAFYNCSSLTSIEIPDSVTSIGSDAFYNCSSLTSIEIPDSVTSIGSYAFYNCTALIGVYITDIDAWVEINFSDYASNPLYYAKNLYLNNEIVTDIDLLEETTKISDYALCNCATLKSIDISDSVTSIGEYAFSGCSSLTGIKIPDSVTSIGEGAFSGCSSLESITLPFVGDSKKTSSSKYQYPFGYIFGTSSYTGGVKTEQRYFGSSTSSTTYDYFYIPSTLKEVTITGGNILYGAFYGCSKLTSIKLPSDITSIGSDAFYNCSSLTSIEIPDSVTSIGSDAFYNCSSLTSIEIPDSVTSIGSYAFSDCSSLTSIEIPDSVTSIGSGAFSDCSSLTSIEIPDGVTSIGRYAFSGCSSLTNIEIPDSVTSIGEETFNGCSSLESITLPFVGSSKKTSSSTYQYPFGYIFGTSSYTGGVATKQYYYGSSTSSTTYDYYYIPSTLKEVTITGGNILYGAFYGCSNLTSIKLLNNITSIGSSAFSGCSSLESMTLPFVGDSEKTSSDTYQYPFGYIFGTSSYTGGVATYQRYSTTYDYFYIPSTLKEVIITGGNILYGAFYGCSNLTSIKLPNDITSIGEDAFCYCSSLTSIEIPDSVTSIGSSAFSDCSSLTSIEIPDGVTTIGSNAFRYCNSIKNFIVDEDNNYYSSLDGVLFNEELTELIQYPVGNTRTNYEIPDSVTSIGEYSFYSCDSLASIEIPDGVTSIGEYAFRYCSSLTSIEIPDGVTSLGEYAFYECSSLTSIEIPDGVTSIGKYAFYECSSLTSIEIPDGVTSIGKYAFYECSSLTSIEIPDSVTSIGEYAFYSCDSLASIEIPNSVTSIEDSAFYECRSLTSIEIPDSVTSIGDDAFCYCRSLTSIEIPDSVTSIDYSAFSGCSSLESITLPFVGGSKKTSSDTYQFPFGYIFGSSSYTGGVATYQRYYGSRTSSTTYDYYYIPSTLKEVTITGGNILYGAFDDCSNLTSIKLPNDMTSIGGSAFYNCSSLTNIEIPDSVTSIGSGAFSDCSSLTSIEIPNSVTSIGYGAFYDCSSLESMTLPFVGGSEKTSSDTDQYPFGYIFGTSYYTDSGYYIPSTLKEVIITGGNILYGAFYGCSNLTSIKLPNDITSIGGSAFYNCRSLTSIEIPDGVTSIGEDAFYNCRSLTSIKIPDSVTSIGNSVFSGCSSLENMTLPFVGGSERTSSDTYQYPFGYIFGTSSYTGGVETYQRYYDSSTSSTIYDYFYIPSTLKEVTITGGNILYGAFDDCSNLTSIKLPSDITSIGGSAFRYCSSLTSIEIPDGVTSIEDSAFYECRSLTSIEIPDSVTSIGNMAFDKCSSLTSIEIPDSVTSIGNMAFDECSSLTSIEIPDSVTSIGGSAFRYCSSLTSIEIPDGVTSIGEYAFYSCDSLASIEIPDSVTSIGGSAFRYCSSLTSIEIPDGVTSIGAYTFSGCSSLISIEIPDGVTSIGSGAFSDCSSLTSIEIPDSVTSIGENAFRYCSSLSDVYYNGTQEAWNVISIKGGNGNLINANIYFHNNHNKIQYPIQEATCVAEGYTAGTYCENCEEWIDGHKKIAAKAHILTTIKGKAATCTETGLTDGKKCSVCNEVLVAQTVVDALGHTPAEAVRENVISATCTSTGSYVEVVYCSVCNAEISREAKTIEIDANTHTDAANVVKNAKEATCKADGYTGDTYWSCCDTLYANGTTIAKKAHTYKTTTTKATLSKDGSIVKKCTVCGYQASKTTIYKPTTFTLSATSYTYNGNVRTPTVTVKTSNGTTLKKNTDHTVTYAEGRKNVGTYNVTIKMIGNYSGTKTLSFKINPINISTCTVKLSSTSYTYNGSVKTPTVTVTNSYGTKLTKNTHYTVTYASGRKNVGTYNVTIKMIGNYTGSKTLTFKINPIKISTCNVKLSSTSYTYNGSVKTPTVTVTNSYGTKLTKDKHYTVTYASGRKNVGTYKVTVKMIGNYTGTKTLTFKINPIKISTCNVKLSTTSYTYNGSAKTPTVTVTNAYGTKLTKNTHYTVTYASGRKNVGTYKVTIKMIGNYTGTKTLTFKINPPKTTVSKLTAGKKSITVDITKKSTQITGYQIQYSTSKDFTNAKTKSITSYSTTKTTLSSLSAAKTYYVRVRTYKTVNDVKYYSGWSAYKSVKTK